MFLVSFCEIFLAQCVASIPVRCIWAARVCHCIVMVDGGGQVKYSRAGPVDVHQGKQVHAG